MQVHIYIPFENFDTELSWMLKIKKIIGNNQDFFFCVHKIISAYFSLKV